MLALGLLPVDPVTRERMLPLPGQFKRKGSRMEKASHTELSDKVLAVIRQKEQCDIDELTRACSRYTWNQVFFEVDRLSRAGELILVYKKGGDYAVRLPPAA